MPKTKNDNQEAQGGSPQKDRAQRVAQGSENPRANDSTAKAKFVTQKDLDNDSALAAAGLRVGDVMPNPEGPANLYQR